MWYRTIPLVFLILLFCCKGYSQPFVDILSIKYQRFPSTDYTEGANKKLSIDQFTSNLNLPIVLKNKDVFLTGGTYDLIQLETKEGSETKIEVQRNLYAFNLQFGYLKTWKLSKWKTLFMLLPKISSDQLRITRDLINKGQPFFSPIGSGITLTINGDCIITENFSETSSCPWQV
jgi:hypothetical protein